MTALMLVLLLGAPDAAPAAVAPAVPAAPNLFQPSFADSELCAGRAMADAETTGGYAGTRRSEYLFWTVRLLGYYLQAGKGAAEINALMDVDRLEKMALPKAEADNERAHCLAITPPEVERPLDAPSKPK